MLTQEKIAAVKKQLRSGVPEGEIKNELKKEGYSENEIAELFKPQQYDMRSWYLLFGILFLVLGLWQLLANQHFLLIVFGVILLVLYYNENNKRKKQPGEE